MPSKNNKIWEHFLEKPDDIDKAICKYCNNHISCEGKKTSNMWRHVRKSHAQDIQDLPGKGLTPYQGNRRCFGEFRCTPCNRRWMSASSWADHGQQCKKCLVNVYPHRQTPLEKPGGLDVCNKTKNHLMDLCQMCRSLGSNCRQHKQLKLKNYKSKSFKVAVSRT